MTDLTAVSLFGGIGGFDKALEDNGVDVRATVEIDPSCREQLARHFPGSALFNDVTEVTGDQLLAAGFVPGRGILCGGFPCFPAGTRVLAARGWLPIEDVTVGDLVLTHAGRWQPVTSTMSRVSDHLINLRGQGLPHISTTDEHPFYARSSRQEWVSRSPAHPAGTFRRVFADPDWTAAAKMAGQFAGQVLPAEEPDDLTEAVWWLVGRYLADGWTTTGSRGRNRVVICCAPDEADELAEQISQVVHATRSDDLTVTKFVITRSWFVGLVDHLGRGAAGKTLTRRELALPASQADALLTGWLTGDGCRTQGKWKGTTVSRSLALSMALLAQRARGIVASLHETAMPATTVISGRTVGQRTQYQVVIPDRNRSAFVEGSYGWKLVRNATRADGPVLVYNLSVAGDESYIADGAIVHNCQDLSIAGRRAGLGGARSGLFWHIVRLADELRPRWLLLENVPGLLSAVCACPGDDSCTANGRAVRCGEWSSERIPGPADDLPGDDCHVCSHPWDVHDAGGFCSPCQDTCAGLPEVKTRRVFIANVPHGVKGGACAGGCMPAHGGAMGTVLGALGKLGYGFAWRVLDAQFFGLAQRRERVFIVGCLGDRAAPVEVLLEPESSTGHPAAGRETRPDTARTLGSRAGGDRTTDLDGAYVTGTLTPGSVGDYDDNTVRAGFMVTAPTITAGWGTNHGAPGHGGKDEAALAVTAATLQGGGRRGHRIDAEGAAGGHLIPFDTAQITSGENRSNPRPGDPAPTLNGNGQLHVAGTLRSHPRPTSAGPGTVDTHAITAREGKGADSDATNGLIIAPVPQSVTGEVTHALTSEGADASEDGTGRGTPIITVPLLEVNGRSSDAADQKTGTGVGGEGDPMFTLRAGKQHGVAVSGADASEDGTGRGTTPMAVRRLTPLECERLQGFPDEWTRWRADGSEESDSGRYRKLGNAVAVPVVRWIARRIVAVDAANSREAVA